MVTSPDFMNYLSQLAVESEVLYYRSTQNFVYWVFISNSIFFSYCNARSPGTILAWYACAYVCVLDKNQIKTKIKALLIQTVQLKTGQV